MDIGQLQDILTNDIDNLTQLRDRLSDEGKPLMTDEKGTIRHHLSGNWLRDMQFEQQGSFMQGRQKELLRNMEYITETLKQFS